MAEMAKTQLRKMTDEEFNLKVQLIASKRPSNLHDLYAVCVDEFYRRLQTKEMTGVEDAMGFMSEIESPCPDLMLRGFYRRRLLESKQ